MGFNSEFKGLSVSHHEAQVKIHKGGSLTLRHVIAKPIELSAVWCLKIF